MNDAHEQVHMRTITRRRLGGFTLVEVLLVVFVMVLIALIFAATFPISQNARMKAAYMSYAVSLARQKIEDQRSAGYAGILAYTETVPVSELPNGSETVTITQYSSNVKKIKVEITWSGYRVVGGEVTLVTLISDHS